MAIMMFVFLTPMVFINNSKKYNLNDALFLIAATQFIGLSFNLLILLRNFSLNYVIYIFLIAIMTDTFALVTGKYIGRNKMAPLISPKKTIEGAIGGSIMGTIAGTLFFVTVINPGVQLHVIIFVTLALSIIGQLGDLVFSAIKRYYDVKDFSNLIPGHGGILDRLDSIIFIVLGFILFLAVL
jgi:phosphatidate cytidylyltransferase